MENSINLFFFLKPSLTEGVMVVIVVTLVVVKLSKASLGDVFCPLVLSNVVVVSQFSSSFVERGSKTSPWLHNRGYCLP